MVLWRTLKIDKFFRSLDIKILKVPMLVWDIEIIKSTKGGRFFTLIKSRVNQSRDSILDMDSTSTDHSTLSQRCG